MSDSVIIFFMHRYNEIDHMVPIAHRWLSSRDVPLYIVLTSYRDRSSDFRLQLLSEFDHCRIVHRRHLIHMASSGSTFAEDSTAKTTEQRTAAGGSRTGGRSLSSSAIELAKEAGRLAPTSIPEKLYSPFASDDYAEAVERAPEILEYLTGDASNAVMAFDWQNVQPYGKPRWRFPHRVIEFCHERGWPVISLPHGDRSYSSALYHDDHLESLIDRGSIERFIDDLHAVRYGDVEQERAERNVYDRYVVPNRYCAERMKPVVDEKTLTILGSPRFNSEWLDTFLPIVPSYEPDYETDADIRAVVFSRQPYFLLNTPLMKRAIRLIASFSDVHVTVKGHTRHDDATSRAFGPDSDLVDSDIQGLEVVWGTSLHSPAMLEWADVAVDMGSSITFEALQRGMPVICLDFAHGLNAIIPDYLPSCGTTDADDLLATMQEIRESGGEPNYDLSNRDEFVADVIENQNGPVLDAYVEFLESFL